MDVPLNTSGPGVCFGWVAVRNTALDRKWSAPPSEGTNASACRESVPLMMAMYSRSGARGSTVAVLQ